MKKSFFNNIIPVLALAACSLGLMTAPAAANTFEAPSSTTVSATPQDDGYTIAWTDSIRISAIEIYYGHGQRGGFVSRVNVGAGKSIQVDSRAVRFNLVGTDGRYLHLECGGNDRTQMPTLRGLAVDCSFTGASGGLEGALVIARG